MTILFFIVDFLLTTLGFWLITLCLPCLGITFAFSWGRAFVLWLIIKIIKIFIG